MKLEQRERIQAWFLEYAAGFASPDGKLMLPLQMKLEHSARVVEDCRRIARGEGWSDDDLLTAETIGWLHDVARFSQFKEFRTFHDPRSVNHGERGWIILREAGILDRCDAREQQRILDGVRYHNRKVIPPEVSADTVRFVKLIRDADKLDIYDFFQHALETNLVTACPEVLLHVTMQGPINPVIMEDVRRRRNPSYQHIGSLADFLLIQMSWVYDINFATSLRLLKERRVLERLAKRLPEEEEVRAIIGEAEAHVNRRLAQPVV